jgi:hypothetical protein
VALLVVDVVPVRDPVVPLIERVRTSRERQRTT